MKKVKKEDNQLVLFRKIYLFLHSRIECTEYLLVAKRRYRDCSLVITNYIDKMKGLLIMNIPDEFESLFLFEVEPSRLDESEFTCIPGKNRQRRFCLTGELLVEILKLIN